jgi:hypothetical protein
MCRWHDPKPKDLTKKHLEIVNSLGKGAKEQDKKINVQTLVAFLYSNNEQTKKEIRETVPFIVA